VTTLWRQYVGAQQNMATPTSAASSGSLINQIANSALAKLLQGYYDLSSEYNPISSLMQMGGYLLKTTTAIWLGAIALSFVFGIGAGFCTSTSPGGVAFEAMLGWVKSIVMLVTTALLVPGAILAYYVPFYPFAVFTFAAIGWFVLVIEGMAAAPLVCVGMTHPEGHDFMGKAEQALMLFLSIFLRPTLMIIGLVASMIISFVAFKMLITGFTEILSSMTLQPHVSLSAAAWHGAAAGGVADGAAGAPIGALIATIGAALQNALLHLITQSIVLVIFGVITMEVIEQCYKLIYQLPNKIMLWIGGPQTGEEYGQMAQGIKGAVSTGAQAAGQAAGAMVEGAGAAGKATGTAMKDRADAGKAKADGDLKTGQ
jgi:defect-in-organelle-trafficking protein DotA